MSRYSRWTARLALVVLSLTAVAACAVAPIHQDNNERVWPLSRHYSQAHSYANVVVVFAWAVVAVVAVVALALLIHRAELTSRPEPRPESGSAFGDDEIDY